MGILKLSTKEISVLDGFIGGFYKTTDGCVVSLGGDENIRELDCGDGSQPYFDICELCLNYIKSMEKSKSHLAQL